MSNPAKVFRRMLTWNSDQVAFCELPLKQKCCFEVPATRLLQDVLRVGVLSKGCLTTDLPDIAEGFLPLSGFVGEGNYSIINSTQWCQLYGKEKPLSRRGSGSRLKRKSSNGRRTKHSSKGSGFVDDDDAAPFVAWLNDVAAKPSLGVATTSG